MRSLLFVAVLITGSILFFGSARAWDNCGAGCHVSASGACVVDGWGSVRNECLAGSRPMRPCPRGLRFKHGACMPFA
jgi:hypothetical protein